MSMTGDVGESGIRRMTVAGGFAPEEGSGRDSDSEQPSGARERAVCRGERATPAPSAADCGEARGPGDSAWGSGPRAGAAPAEGRARARAGGRADGGAGPESAATSAVPFLASLPHRSPPSAPRARSSPEAAWPRWGSGVAGSRGAGLASGCGIFRPSCPELSREAAAASSGAGGMGEPHW